MLTLPPVLPLACPCPPLSVQIARGHEVAVTRAMACLSNRLTAVPEAHYCAAATKTALTRPSNFLTTTCSWPHTQQNTNPSVRGSRTFLLQPKWLPSNTKCISTVYTANMDQMSRAGKLKPLLQKKNI